MTGGNGGKADNLEQFPGMPDNLEELKPEFEGDEIGKIDYVQPEEVNIVHDEDEAKNYDADRKYVRSKMYKVVEAGDAAIQNALKMMQETMGVRELEAASSLIRNTVEALSKLQESSSKAMKDSVALRGRNYEEQTDKAGRVQGNLSDIADGDE